MLSEQRLVEIEAREKAATGGPWHICAHNGVLCQCLMIWSKSEDVCVAVPNGPHWYNEIGDPYPNLELSQNNARFLCESRTDIPDLLAEVRRLKTALGEQS